MSYNQLLNTDYVIDLQSVLTLLEGYFGSWQAATTLEERALIESHGVDLLNKLLSIDFDFQNVRPTNYPTAEELGAFYEENELILKSNNNRLQSLIQEFLRKVNSYQIKLLELDSKFRRIKQKESVLSLLTSREDKYVVSEEFVNHDNLNYMFVSSPAGEVCSDEGVFVLPIKTKEVVQPKNIIILKESNGNPGNSDEAITFNNLNPFNTLNQNDQNWFEYERLDNGPCELNLLIDFNKPVLLNNLRIVPVNINNSTPIEVVDVVFNTSSNNSISLKDITAETKVEDFILNFGQNGSAWEKTFLPVVAKSVILKFKQTTSYYISTTSPDDRIVPRARFAIGLKSISFNKITFANEGGINSSIKNIPVLYAVEPECLGLPKIQDLYNAVLEVSFDGGETWSLQNIQLGQKGKIVLNKELGTSFVWRLGLTRNNQAFSEIETFFPEVSAIRNVDSVLKTVNRNSSPAVINLNANPKNGQLTVIQPGVITKSATKQVQIGVSNGQVGRYDLPVDIFKLGEPEDLQVFVDGLQWTLQPNNSVNPVSGTWVYSDDFKSIYLDGVHAGSQIAVSLAPETIYLEKTNNGFVANFKNSFDPDKSKIKLYYLENRAKLVSTLLPKDQTIINLPFSNLYSDTWQWSGNNWTESATKANVFAGSNLYYVDYTNGIIYLSSNLGSDTVRVSFRHRTKTEVDKNDFGVVFEGTTPKGVALDIGAVSGFDVEEVLDGNITQDINLTTGAYEARIGLVSSDTVKLLSYDCILPDSVKINSDLLTSGEQAEEVPFINGEVEFEGLLYSNTETTSAISASGGISTFNLAAGALWRSAYGISFSNYSVFANQVSTAALVAADGDFHVSAGGVVTVYGDVPADIAIGYYYANRSFYPNNKYSVDYKNGILYSYSPINSTSIIQYKTVCVIAEYDVATELEDWVFDTATKLVSIKTENLNPVNNLVKIFWNKRTEEQTLADRQNFFSPLVSNINFRFN